MIPNKFSPRPRLGVVVPFPPLHRCTECGKRLAIFEEDYSDVCTDCLNQLITRACLDASGPGEP